MRVRTTKKPADSLAGFFLQHFHFAARLPLRSGKFTIADIGAEKSSSAVHVVIDRTINFWQLLDGELASTGQMKNRSAGTQNEQSVSRVAEIKFHTNPAMVQKCLVKWCPQSDSNERSTYYKSKLGCFQTSLSVSSR